MSGIIYELLLHLSKFRSWCNI